MSSISRTLVEAGSIFLLALSFAFSTNAIRSDGLPLKGDWSQETLQKRHAINNLKTVTLNEAYQAFQKGEAVFVDARPWDEYRRGHIKGALNLPWVEASNSAHELEDFLPRETEIITYCDGAACTLSSNLALLMKEFGYDNVWILVNGWSLWKDANYPIEKERNE